MEAGGMPSGGLWSAEDLDLLASDLDSSLSGLGGNTSDSFDMSGALSAIQVIKINKEELERDYWQNHVSFSDLNKTKAKSVQDLRSWYSPHTPGRIKQSSAKNVKKPCIKHQKEKSNEIIDLSPQAPYASSVSSETSVFHAPTVSYSLSQYSLQPGLTMKEPFKTDFQYVLAAATAHGSKIGEDTLTYLNQGQSYEIRLKKLQGISEMKGKILKSILRVGFQERRLQYREKMEIISWQCQRPAERILDIDLSLSYGIFDVMPDSRNINSCEFMWDPSREASVFLKVNCISTDFTSKRRGGEKGVPFRILIETYSHWENPARKLDAASCLVKVFKSKGADRKHKTDKERLEKLPLVEQRDLQPSYQCTVFTPCSATVENIPFQDFSDNMAFPPLSNNFDVKPESPSNTEVVSANSSPRHISEVFSPGSDDSGVFSPIQPEVERVTENLSTAEVHSWLSSKKFSKYLSCFSLYSGKDLLCLSRDDFIEICGAADGIRLYNSLHIKEPPPLRKLYISKDKISFYGVYLHALRCSDLKDEVCKTYGLKGTISNIYVTGPDRILLVVTDKVLQNLKDESTYICDILKGENDNYTIILRSYIPEQQQRKDVNSLLK